uniref:Uncharacterized protein n=1 Tax=Emiliania huxleyi (strain CCMP1516) TaxID=280463 RepID=A0A0D3L1W6_EMIH1
MNLWRDGWRGGGRAIAPGAGLHQGGGGRRLPRRRLRLRRSARAGSPLDHAAVRGLPRQPRRRRGGPAILLCGRRLDPALARLLQGQVLRAGWRRLARRLCPVRVLLRPLVSRHGRAHQGALLPAEGRAVGRGRRREEAASFRHLWPRAAHRARAAPRNREPRRGGLLRQPHGRLRRAALPLPSPGHRPLLQARRRRHHLLRLRLRAAAVPRAAQPLPRRLQGRHGRARLALLPHRRGGCGQRGDRRQVWSRLLALRHAPRLLPARRRGAALVHGPLLHRWLSGWFSGLARHRSHRGGVKPLRCPLRKQGQLAAPWHTQRARALVGDEFQLYSVY